MFDYRTIITELRASRPTVQVDFRKGKKMAKKNVHVVPNGNNWSVVTEGTEKPLSNHRTQQAATEAGRKVAIESHCELVIHRPSGQIRDKDSYGNDPCPPKDKRG